MIARLACGVLLAAGAAAGCEGPARAAPTDDRLWRDQLVFVGDEGTVLPIVVVRRGDGRAEAKGWLGRGGAWESVYFQELRVPPGDAPDLEASAAALSRAPGTGARITLHRSDSEIALSLRRPSSLLHLGARPVTPLGAARDPEGPSVLRAGRATLRAGDGREHGWLLVEETPADDPRRAFVEYGDYLLLFAVLEGERPVVLRRSLGRAGFDHAFVGGGAPRHGTAVRVDRDAGELAVRLEDLGIAAEGTITARALSHGVAPSGRAATYEVLLVEGDVSGVAFTIRSEGTGGNE